MVALMVMVTSSPTDRFSEGDRECSKVTAFSIWAESGALSTKIDTHKRKILAKPFIRLGIIEISPKFIFFLTKKETYLSDATEYAIHAPLGRFNIFL